MLYVFLFFSILINVMGFICDAGPQNLKQHNLWQ